MTGDADIRLEAAEDGVAVVTLHRPAKRNAVTLDMWRRLPTAFAVLQARPAVKVVVLTGAGGHFSAGADIGEFDATRGDVASGTSYDDAVEAACRALRDLAKPTIAAIDGVCFGGGCALAMSCDFRIAGQDASFAIPAARLGIVYSVSDCRNLVVLVGLARAKKILFTGERFSAAEAFAMGFVDERLETAATLSAARTLAVKMTANAPLALKGLKLTLNAIAEGATAERAPDIRRAVREAMESSDVREGRLAFLERRPPRFTGE
jgi:enoyl-CoA hydratase/carnithine racemase